MRALLFWQIRFLDGLEQTRENGSGAPPAISEEAGTRGAAQAGRVRTAFGALVLYCAAAPAPDDGHR